MEDTLKKNIAVILHRPRYPENIGSAARACLNFGINRLIVISPRIWNEEKILQMATHHAKHVVESIEVFNKIDEILPFFTFLVGTTARKGIKRGPFFSPREVAMEIRELDKNHKIGILFGPEDRGLTNEEIKLCQRVVTIPTTSFSSLNVAQAVTIFLYEIFTAKVISSKRSYKKLDKTPASIKQIELMYNRLEETLKRIGFIHPEGSSHWMLSLRRLFSRKGVLRHEANIIMGICRQIDWAIEHPNELLTGSTGTLSTLKPLPGSGSPCFEPQQDLLSEGDILCEKRESKEDKQDPLEDG